MRYVSVAIDTTSIRVCC